MKILPLIVDLITGKKRRFKEYEDLLPEQDIVPKKLPDNTTLTVPSGHQMNRCNIYTIGTDSVLVIENDAELNIK